VPNARLRLVGPANPSYRSELVELARKEGVYERVAFTTPVPPEEVVETARPATVGLALIQPVCLSYRMSLPNKLFEYMAAGIPVLGSDLPVISSFIQEHGVGLVARPDDVEDVASKLAQMLHPPGNSAFRLAIREAATHLRWEDESRLLAETYVDAATMVGR
jgi:glycosyltransferase involved in cell wall biosynthesis